jgi:DNA repair ATPase RecN
MAETGDRTDQAGTGTDTEETLAAKVEDLTAEVEKWKGLSRKNEDRAKDNADAAKRVEALEAQLEELKNTDATDTQKLEKKIAKLTEDLAAEGKARREAELTGLRNKVGAEKGLPPALISRLSGDDEESIAADADALLEALPEESRVDLGQGDLGSDTSTTDPLVQAVMEKIGPSQ